MHARVGTIGGAAHDDEHKKTTITDVHELKALLLYKSSARRTNQTVRVHTVTPLAPPPPPPGPSSLLMMCAAIINQSAGQSVISSARTIIYFISQRTPQSGGWTTTRQQACRQAGRLMHECVHARMQRPQIPIYLSIERYV
eukprot:GHVU01209339.1.p1 GENE.GHVU01209339.1~~GHVU01209339.1.p1  ORF type:complete len:141 (+),score=17.76 GHVU01209339.1:295-717(+)